uniref:Enoyl-CoA hydratase n=1 Tax=Oryza nivara TaxID=4536 RepID=A0A0E0GAJ9_ORYNI
MRILRGILAVSGHLAGRRAPANNVHLALFSRALQILAQQEPVRLQKLSAPDSGIVEMRLERPEARNAIGREMLQGLRSAIEKVKADATANVVLLASSVPKVFCAGADLKERRLMSPCEVREFVNSLRSTFLSFERLPRIVGKSRAKELIFTGRRFDAVEAVTMGKKNHYDMYVLIAGVVNYCVPAGEAYKRALELAQEINQKGPLAIRMAKKAINQGMEVDLSAGLAVEEECYEQVLHTQDRLEGLAAFAEKRKPVYTGK